MENTKIIKRLIQHYIEGSELTQDEHFEVRSLEKQLADINYTRCSTDLPDEDAKLLYRLLPEWAKKTEKGLNPFFYGTNSYKGDKAIVNKVKAILKKAIT